MNKAILALVLTLFCVSSTFLGAQDTKRKISARFLYLNKHSQTPSELLLMGKKGPEEVNISTRSPRDYFQLPSDGKIILGVPNIDPEDKKNPITPLATGMVPANASKVLVLLSPIKEGNYSMMILNEQNFNGGSICFINQSGQPIGVTLGKKKLMVKNKSTEIYKPFSSSKPQNTHISFHVAEVVDGKTQMKTLAENIWNISPRRGEICIFYRDQLRKKAAYKVFASHFSQN